MTFDERKHLHKSAVSLANKLEDESTTVSDIEPFDITVETTIDGRITEIRLADGQGPHTEIELGSEMIAAYSHGESVRVHFDNSELADELWNYYTDLYEDNQ